MLGRWVHRLINQASEGAGIILLGRLKIKQGVAGLNLEHSKLFIFHFCKVIKNIKNI